MTKKMKAIQEKQKANAIKHICKCHGKHVARKLLSEQFDYSKQEAFEIWEKHNK